MYLHSLSNGCDSGGAAGVLLQPEYTIRSPQGRVKPIRRGTQQSPAEARKGGSRYGMDDFYVTIPYGLVVLGGGIAGYVKRGSAASLAAGAGFGGALLLAGALSIWAFARHSSSLFATVLETARGCWSLPGGRKVKGEEADATVRRSGKRGFAETIDLKLKLEPALAATLAVGDEEVADGVIAAEPVSSPGG